MRILQNKKPFLFIAKNIRRDAITLYNFSASSEKRLHVPQSLFASSFFIGNNYIREVIKQRHCKFLKELLTDMLLANKSAVFVAVYIVPSAVPRIHFNTFLVFQTIRFIVGPLEVISGGVVRPFPATWIHGRVYILYTENKALPCRNCIVFAKQSYVSESTFLFAFTKSLRSWTLQKWSFLLTAETQLIFFY